MRSRYTVREPERAHFVTSTVVDWLPVFTTAACCDILAGSFDYCRREKGLRLYAWVIMENHFHAVVHADDLPRVMADLKKFTADKLLAQLAAERRTWLLDLLAAGKAAHKTRSTWQLWQEGYHPQAIYADQTMMQKIDYIHANPVRRGWIASPSTGATAPRTSGCLAACLCSGAISGGEGKRSSSPGFAISCSLAFSLPRSALSLPNHPPSRSQS